MVRRRSSSSSSAIKMVIGFAPLITRLSKSAPGILGEMLEYLPPAYPFGLRFASADKYGCRKVRALSQLLGDELLQFNDIHSEFTDALGCFLGCHGVVVQQVAEGFLI